MICFIKVFCTAFLQKSAYPSNPGLVCVTQRRYLIFAKSFAQLFFRKARTPDTADDILKKREDVDMWFVFALLSAVFAALTSILAKVGIDGVNSNLATAIRTVVVVVMAWGMVFLTNAQGGLSEIGKKSWLFLILSGLATGASWLCYYRALQLGETSKVVPIDKLSVVITLILAFVFLHEQFTAKSLIGCILIGAGTLIMVL